MPKPGANGRAFQTESIHEWALSLGALQVIKGSERSDPIHWDGGSSFLHLGITLHGRRTLFLTAEAEPGLEVQTERGHVYCGNLAAAEHHVCHAEPQATEEAMQTTN